MQGQQKNSGGKFILGTVVIIVIGIVGFFIFNKITSRDMKTAVVNRLTEGVIKKEKKPEATPEEKVLKAVNVNRSRTVKIYVPLKDTATTKDKESGLLAKGIIFSKKGVIVTAKGSFQKGVPYSIAIPGRKDLISASPIILGEQFVVFNVDNEMPLVATMGTTELKKGDLVVAVGGRQEDTMATGEILKIDKTSGGSVLITTTIPSKSVEVGAPLMDVNEAVIGLYLKRNSDGTTVFVSSEGIEAVVKTSK